VIVGWLLLQTLTAASSIAQDATAQDAKAFRIELDQITLEWAEKPTDAEIAGIKAEVLRQHARVAAMLAVEPPERIHIVLSGDARQQDGSWETSRVDWLGRVLLFRFTNDYKNYFTALPHELVHAFRFGRRATADWFFEEGFAEFIALRVDPSLGGFPWFDFPVTVVAGQWLASGEAIPLSLLRDKHRQLNGQCGAQSYALRSAFFVWLGDSFGDDTVLAAAKASPAGGLDDYEKFFGKSFETLVAEWQVAALAEFKSIEGATEQAKRFRTQSPIQYQHVCEEGEDF
jgi:hypothetical protein